MRYVFLYLSIMFFGCDSVAKSSPIVSDVNEAVYREAFDIDKAISKIKCFYAACMSDEYLGKSDSLEKSMLTPYMIEKVHRMSYMMDAYAILRAQDYTDEMLQSLQVEYIEDRWFRVTYKHSLEKKSEKFDIPLRMNDHYMIDFITPPWNESTAYGDLLFFDDYPEIEIDDRHAERFLRTFYAAYTSRYVTLCDGLQSLLSEMRKQYGTDEFLAQWREAESDSRNDGTPFYDILIADYDFDKRWIASLQVEYVGDGIYRVGYRNDRKQLVEIELELVQVEGRYRINFILG